MTINGRLLLLAVVIGIFVRLWTPQSAPRLRPVTRSRPGIAQHAPTLVAVVRVVPELPSLENPATSPSTTVEVHWTSATCPIALPAGIARGHYRVVNAAGQVARLTVSSDRESETTEPPVATMEFYVTGVGQQRWYFIRLQSNDTDSATAAVETPKPVPEPASEGSPPFTNRKLLTNRKFDFTGYEAVGQTRPLSVENQAIEQSSRPRPPELPTAY
ncbi:MAG: hypothetical protein EXS05_09930 [Planctomycetaceae bacterium]|nr:hypothetical protein [Planctomycetaceae bacterium]